MIAFSCCARSNIQAEGKNLLEKHAIAPSAARLCWAALPIRSVFFRAIGLPGEIN